MSHFINVTTQIKDRKSLVRALLRMGFTADQVEINEVAKEMTDYYGGKKKAHVIIRRKNTKIPSDIGFEKSKDGTFVAYIDEYRYGNSPHYNADWQKRLFTLYGVEAAKRVYERQGISYKEEEDSKKRIRLRAFI